MAHHHHHHHGASDEHRDPHLPPAPMDAANQSLADALRASFNVLKFIMFVLIVLFLLTGVKFIQPHEQAVVLRFGRLLDGTRGQGPSVAFPYPIDETLRVPVAQDNVVPIEDHFISRNEEERKRPLSQLGRATLDPVKDGALLTSDGGLVHIEWRLVYRIENLVKFVSTVADGGTADADGLIKAILDNAAIHVAASEYTAGGITRYQAGEMAARVKGLVNQRLEELGTGIRVTALDVPQSSVPIPTLQAFADVSSAENQKQKRIREAEQERDKILNTCAGEAYPQVLAALETWEKARVRDDAAATAKAREDLDHLIEYVAGGEARAEVFKAKAYYTEAVQGIQADEEEYHALMEEYLRAPDLLFARMWSEAKRRMFQYPGLDKWHLPPGQKVVRIDVGPDPKQRLLDEMKEIQKQEKGAGRK
jgi:modulator of FtsH protease HflK